MSAGGPHAVTRGDVNSLLLHKKWHETKSSAQRDKHEPKVVLTPESLQDFQTRPEKIKKTHFVDSPKNRVSLKHPFFNAGFVYCFH
jgi:hypothetical protein